MSRFIDDLGKQERQQLQFYQKEVGDCGVYTHALSVINEKSSKDKLLESFELLNEMMMHGFTYNQTLIIQELKKDNELETNFFSFFLSFFHSWVKTASDQIKSTKQRKLGFIKTEKVYKDFARITVSFFQFIEYVCEN